VEREYHKLYSEIGMGTTIWSPLASGVLTGKYADGIPDGSRLALPEYQWLRDRIETEEGRAKIAKAGELQTVANDLGISMAQLAIAWCLKNPNVSTVILGASNVEQLEQNLASADKLDLLTDDVLERVETILDNRPELPTQF
jgi:aryl-alcohol dehydrogenase-like predicted oxidoreductase